MKPSTVKIKKMPSRFKHQIPKYKVTRSTNASIAEPVPNHVLMEFMKGLKDTIR